MLYTLNLDNNNYVLSIAHTSNDNIELDLSDYDLSYLTCYQLIDNKLVLDETKKAQLVEQENKQSLAQELSQCESPACAALYILLIKLRFILF